MLWWSCRVFQPSLTVRFLPSDWRFLGGLAFTGLGTPRYFLPVSTLDSCFARTSKHSHASFTVPSLKYFFDIFNQMAAVKMWVGLFRGSWDRQGALGTGRTIFHTFSLFSFSVVLALLSSVRFKNPSGMLSCTSGQTAPFIMDSRVAFSVTFARALKWAQTSDRCSCACAVCSKISTMNTVSSATWPILAIVL